MLIQTKCSSNKWIDILESISRIYTKCIIVISCFFFIFLLIEISKNHDKTICIQFVRKYINGILLQIIIYIYIWST